MRMDDVWLFELGLQGQQLPVQLGGDRVVSSKPGSSQYPSQNGAHGSCVQWGPQGGTNGSLQYANAWGGGREWKDVHTKIRFQGR
ncbi:MAG: hypothetical protein CM1200mP14_22060 [Gammaproteobacteria bacterium]|nr:MAG: hypothetical protein CM1200mP14_22060 [Gammaproteobacteria bacterium]